MNKKQSYVGSSILKQLFFLLPVILSTSSIAYVFTRSDIESVEKISYYSVIAVTASILQGFVKDILVNIPSLVLLKGRDDVCPQPNSEHENNIFNIKNVGIGQAQDVRVYISDDFYDTKETDKNLYSHFGIVSKDGEVSVSKNTFMTADGPLKGDVDFTNLFHKKNQNGYYPVFVTIVYRTQVIPFLWKNKFILYFEDYNCSGAHAGHYKMINYKKIK